MPELPEVEHVRQNLHTWIVGARITDAHVDDKRIFAGGPARFAKLLVGRTVTEVDRRGKWLRIELDDGTNVFAHLGMTGDWTLGGSDRFERARLLVEKKGEQSIIRYTDARRWGRIDVVREPIKAWKALGPDPLVDGIDVDRLADRLARRKKASVKEVLMDQTVLAGVGNIQAIEALWKAKIDPRSNAAAMDAKDVAAIARGIHWTIARTLADHAKGEDGEDNPFKIYGRKGTPCPRCKKRLVRIELGGRTTTYCPGCQVRKRTRRVSGAAGA